MNPILQLLQFLLCLLATDRVVVTGIQPNPGGDAEVLVAQGWFWVASTNKLVELRLIVELPATGQLSWRAADRARSEWNGKLGLGAGDYECWVELITRNAAGALTVTRPTAVRVTVK